MGDEPTPDNPLDEVIPEPIQDEADKGAEIPPWGQELKDAVEELKGHSHPAPDPTPDPEPDPTPDPEPEPEPHRDSSPSKPPWTHRHPFRKSD